MKKKQKQLDKWKAKQLAKMQVVIESKPIEFQKSMAESQMDGVENSVTNIEMDPDDKDENIESSPRQRLPSYYLKDNIPETQRNGHKSNRSGVS